MSKNIKNRVFALILGIIICLNVCVLNTCKTEAVVSEAVAGVAVGAAGVGVGPAVVIGVLTAIAGAFIISVFDGPVPDGEDTNKIASDFANWVAENRETEFNYLKNKIAFNVTSGGIDTMKFLADVDTVKTLSSLFSIYLTERASITAEGASFSFSSVSGGVYNFEDFSAALKQVYCDCYGVSVSELTYRSDWNTYANKIYSAYGNYDKPYITAIFCNEPTGCGFDGRYRFLLLLSSTSYDPHDNTGAYYAYGVPFDGFSQTGVFGQYFNVDQFQSGYQVVANFYADPSAASVEDSPCDVIDLGLAESLKKQIDNISDNVDAIADAIDTYIQDQVKEEAGSVIIHYPDGTTTVFEGTDIWFPGYVDADDNVVVPDDVTTDTADDVFAKPDTDVYNPEGSAADAPAGANTSFLSKILDWLKSFWTLLQKLLALIFVPDLTPFNTLKPDIQDKFGFVAQIAELWGQFTDSDFGSQRPDFKITIPASFLHSSNDVDCLIIDFSLFDQYRTILHHIIILLAYMAFFKRLLNDLPSLLGYVGGRSHTVVVNNRNTYNY